MSLNTLLTQYQNASGEDCASTFANDGCSPMERIVAANKLLLAQTALPATRTRFEQLFSRLSKGQLIEFENRMPDLAPATCRAIGLELKLRQTEGALWFFLEKGKERQGPMPFLEFDQRLRALGREAQVHVWRNGWPDWVPLSKCDFLRNEYFFKADSGPVHVQTNKPIANRAHENVKYPFMIGFTEMLLVPVWFILVFVAPWGDQATLGRAISFILPIGMAGLSLVTAIGFWTSGAWVVRFKLATSVVALIYLLVAIFVDDRGFMFKLALGLHLLTLFIIFNFNKKNTMP